MCIQRPIHVSTGVTRTSWYRLMRPVKEKSIDSGIDAGLEVRFLSLIVNCVYYFIDCFLFAH